MVKTTEDLEFINFLKSLGRSLDHINEVTSNSQQHEDHTPEEIKLIEKLHYLYYTEEVSFGKGNMDVSKLKVQ